MSILQPTSSDQFIHVEDLHKIIAQDLNVEPSQIQLVTNNNIIPAADMWSSEETEFSSLTAKVEMGNGLEKIYEISKNQLKELIASNLNIDLKNLSFEFTCNYGPSGQGEELNYINVSNKKPEVNLHNTLNKVQSFREENFTVTEDNTNRNNYR